MRWLGLVTEVDEGRHSLRRLDFRISLTAGSRRKNSQWSVDDFQLQVGDGEVRPSGSEALGWPPSRRRYRFLLCAPRGPAWRTRQEAFREDHPHQPWSDPPGVRTGPEMGSHHAESRHRCQPAKIAASRNPSTVGRSSHSATRRREGLRRGFRYVLESVGATGCRRTRHSL